MKDKLYESGDPFGIIELKTDVVLSSLPTEKGLKIMRDLDGINPVEAGLGWTVDWSKDFVGKEAVLKSKEEGPKQSLLGFTVEDDTAEVELESDIKLNGRFVGTVTNYTYGFTVEKNIGFALIDNAVAKVGDKVKIGVEEIDAYLTKSKFFDPKDKRRRGEI